MSPEMSPEMSHKGDSPGCHVELGAAPKPPLLCRLITLALTVSLFSNFFPPQVFKNFKYAQQIN